ncbi:hypothetical protein JCM11491_000304 [Sporobolomyces phaffii]
MDDLLDLDFSSSKPAAAKASGQASYGSGRSAFDYLAKSTTSTAVPSRPAQPTLRSVTPLQPKTNGTSSTAGGGGGGDAFSSLFGSTSIPSPSNAPVSMAERLAKERAASPAFGYPLAPSSRSNSPALQPVRNSPSPALPSPQARLNTPPILRPNAPPSNLARTPAPPASAKPPNPWDFDLLSSSVPATRQSQSPRSEADPFDLGFDAPTAPSTRPPAVPPTTSANARDEFDLLDAFSAQPAAVQPAPPTPDTPGISSSSSQTPARNRNKAAAGVVSPPPELLLKLTTELGFSLPDANRALIETFEKTGRFGLEDAVEMLMSSSSPTNEGTEPGNGKSTTPRKNQREIDEWGDDEMVTVGRRRSWELEDQPQQRPKERQGGDARPRERRANPGAESPKPSTNGATAEGGGSGDIDQAAKVLQEQASEVLSQAQKIGFSMFKSANAYWGAGKEALAKKLEEQRKAARIAAGLPAGTGASSSSAGGRDGTVNGGGKPKWWKEGMDLDDDAAEKTTSRGTNGKGKQSATAPSGFKDSDEEEGGSLESVLPERPTTSRPPQHSAPSPAATEYRSPFRRQKAAAVDSAPPPPVPVDADLLAGSAAVPSRAAPSPRRPPPASSRPVPPSHIPAPSPSPRAPIPRRSPVSISPSALKDAISHKSTGNSDFKLGRFSDATAAYTRAIELVPPTWIGRVVLLNNRAQSRLKSGEEKAAIEDCTESLQILSAPTGGKVDKVALEAENGSLGDEVRELAGAQVDLRDLFGKSLGRRAKGYEVTEKWTLALADWEQVRNSGDDVVVRGAGGSKLVADGVARCRKMVDPTPPVSASTSAGPRSRPAPSVVRPKPTATARSTNEVQGSGEAVKALQAAQALQLAEDDLRLQFKDQVDERIAAWKTSKETNLRALIASLDNVLWAELGWKKVGMNELITESQLKVRYVRAIAKVHPDKLNVGNATVEQRMIAGAVFAALNEAWNATKA